MLPQLGWSQREDFVSIIGCYSKSRYEVDIGFEFEVVSILVSAWFMVLIYREMGIDIAHYRVIDVDIKAEMTRAEVVSEIKRKLKEFEESQSVKGGRFNKGFYKATNAWYQLIKVSHQYYFL